MTCLVGGHRATRESWAGRTEEWRQKLIWWKRVMRRASAERAAGCGQKWASVGGRDQPKPDLVKDSVLLFCRSFCRSWFTVLGTYRITEASANNRSFEIFLVLRPELRTNYNGGFIDKFPQALASCYTRYNQAIGTIWKVWVSSFSWGMEV